MLDPLIDALTRGARSTPSAAAAAKENEPVHRFHVASRLIAALALVLVVGGGPMARVASAQETDPIRVTTTVGMIADLAANVGGERIEVTGLMGPGVDPHLYKPSAGDIGRLEEADIIFYGGLELEGRMTDTLVKIARAGKPTVPVTEDVPEELLREPVEFQGKFDPHIWFDVTLWKYAAQTVKDELAALDPESDATFQANFDAYLVQLDELHAYIQQEIARIPEGQRVLITAHDAFGYFGQQCGMEVRGLQGTSTATEAGAGDVQELAAFIVERRIPAIFVESSVPPATIEAVQAAARSQGWEVAIGGELFSDAMGEDGTPEGTYLGMVRHNVDSIAGALAGTAEATPPA